MSDREAMRAAREPQREKFPWTVETMLIINKLTPDIKGKAFDPDWFLLRQRFEQFEAEADRSFPGYREWISVEEKLPEMFDSLPEDGIYWSKSVLAAEGSAMELAKYHTGKEGNRWLTETGDEMEVTHWMPLPEAPGSPNSPRVEAPGYREMREALRKILAEAESWHTMHGHDEKWPQCNSICSLIPEIRAALDKARQEK